VNVERPEKATARRQEIVDAAVALADAEGLEAVSMRRLAEKLGVGTMTPYSYVADKDELLDLMLDEIGRGMLLPEPLPDDWRQALRAIALSTRATIEAHPWIFRGQARRPRGRINTMRHIEQSIAAVLMLGVDRETGARVLMAVDDYVLGHCFRKRMRERMTRAMATAAGTGKPAENGERPPLDPEVEAAMEAGELPLIARGFKERRAGAFRGVPPEGDFETGLDWLLDGIEALAERGRPVQPGS
jgi:AcrR family transcriptional regulator